MSSETTKNSTTTEAATSTPVVQPCAMGCGFFGSSGTQGCCSSCWRSKQQEALNDSKSPPSPSTTSTSTKTCNVVVVPTKTTPTTPTTTTTQKPQLGLKRSHSEQQQQQQHQREEEEREEKLQPSGKRLCVREEKEQVTPLAQEETKQVIKKTNTMIKKTQKTNKKKKKKKFSSILSNMLSKTAPRDISKEKEALRKNLGGGAFSKIEKI